MNFADFFFGKKGSCLARRKWWAVRSLSSSAPDTNMARLRSAEKRDSRPSRQRSVHFWRARAFSGHRACSVAKRLRCTRAPVAVPGIATAVAESTRFAGPALALRPWRVTRRRWQRRGWPWPEARFRPLMARHDREPRTWRSWCCVPTGAISHRRACERGEGSGAARRRKRPPSQPSATFTRGLRVIAALGRFRPRTGR